MQTNSIEPLDDNDEKKVEVPVASSSSSTSNHIDNDDDQEYTLKTKNGNIFTLKRKEMKLSKFLDALLDDPSSTEYRLDMSHDQISRVVNYLRYHSDVEVVVIEKPLRSNILRNVTDAFDADLVDHMSMRQLTNLTTAANFFDIPSLLHLCAAKIAALFRYRTFEQITELFKHPDEILDDPPAEEEEKETVDSRQDSKRKILADISNQPSKVCKQDKEEKPEMPEMEEEEEEEEKKSR